MSEELKKLLNKCEASLNVSAAVLSSYPEAMFAVHEQVKRIMVVSGAIGAYLRVMDKEPVKRRKK